MVNWNPYLESIGKKYAQWWRVYTLTDVEDRQQVKVEPPLLNFMVETIQPAKEEPNQKQEKTERLVVLEGLRKYAKDHVLLVGRPGSGKSTALARLLLEEAGKYRETDRQQKVLVLVELRYYQTSVLDLIRSFFKQHGLLLDKTEIERLLFDNRLLLLVDGLNELPSEAARQDLSCFRRENATTPMIFTTRDLNVGGDLGIAKKLEMQPLTERQMRDFVRSYLPEQGDRLLQQLSDRLREFGQTPLLLMMLCDVFKATGNVPSNLGLVFRQFTKFYDRQRLQNVLLLDELRRWWQRLLEHLAWKMTQGRELTELQVAISRQEVEEIFTEFLRQEGFDKPRDRAMAWLEYSLKHHLVQLGAEDKIEFRHQLIQEYYTAEELLDKLPKLDNDKLKREYLNYLKWTEPLALMLEMVEQEEQAVRVVKLASEVDLRLAARLAGAVKLEFQKKTVALIAGIEIAQKVKVELLGITRSSNAIALLQQVLNYEDSYVGLIVVEALGNIGTEAAVTALIQALNDEHFYVRLSAVEALGNIGTEAAVTALIQALNDEHSYVRLNTAEALGNIGNEAAVTILIQTLDDKDYNVRRSAAEALGKIGNEAAVTALIQTLNDRGSDVRWKAAKALGNIGTEAAVTALIQTLNDEHSYVGLIVVEALGNIGTEAAVTALIQTLNDRGSDVRWKAANVLGNIGTKAAVAALIQTLNDRGSDVRRSAAEALGKIGNEAAVTTLIQTLDDKDYNVRWSAVEALGKIGNEAAVTTLIQTLDDKDYNVRRSAANVLGNIGTKAAVAALIQTLNDRGSDVRRSAAEALGKIGNEAAVTALIQALDDKDYNVRWSVVEALGEIGNEAAVTALIQTLNDRGSDVRWSAVEALGKIGNEAAVTALIQALDDKDYNVRWSAAEALGNIGNEAEVLGNTASSELLPHFFKRLQATGESYLLNTISAIQERCQYYNYPLTQIEPLLKPKPDVMHLLHLSDLHFGTLDNARNWYSQIAEDLIQELDRPYLNALILSGDIANRSTPEEYAAAKEFLDKLCKEFDLNQEQVIIVPGNHDLNWEISDRSYKPEKRKKG